MTKPDEFRLKVDDVFRDAAGVTKAVWGDERDLQRDTTLQQTGPGKPGARRRR